MILALLGGIIRYQGSIPIVNANSVQYYNDKTEIELKGPSAGRRTSGTKAHTSIFRYRNEDRDGWQN